MPMRAPSLRACGCVVASGQKCAHMVAADKARKARFDQQRPLPVNVDTTPSGRRSARPI